MPRRDIQTYRPIDLLSESIVYIHYPMTMVSDL
jgi:hypothetical protein